MFLKVGNVGAERMSSGRLFQATGPDTRADLLYRHRPAEHTDSECIAASHILSVSVQERKHFEQLTASVFEYFKF